MIKPKNSENTRSQDNIAGPHGIKKYGVEISYISITDRLLGGVVFVENLYKDPGGRLFMNLDKYDTTAQGMYF